MNNSSVTAPDLRIKMRELQDQGNQIDQKIESLKIVLGLFNESKYLEIVIDILKEKGGEMRSKEIFNSLQQRSGEQNKISFNSNMARWCKHPKIEILKVRRGYYSLEEINPKEK